MKLPKAVVQGSNTGAPVQRKMRRGVDHEIVVVVKISGALTDKPYVSKAPGRAIGFTEMVSL